MTHPVPTYTPCRRPTASSELQRLAGETNLDVLVRLGWGVFVLGLGVLTWIALIGGAEVMVTM